MERPAKDDDEQCGIRYWRADRANWSRRRRCVCGGVTKFYPYIWGSRFYGSACTERATLHSAWFQAQFSPGSVIATASAGTAIRFLNSPAYAFPTGEVDGDVATGGGAVSGTSARGFYGLEGIIDTSGR